MAGRLGLGGKVEIGDYISVFAVPEHLLRLEENQKTALLITRRKRIQCFSQIGETYVYGIMVREVFELNEVGERREERTRLE